jgi:glycosyltransferase involved in cell wall biosynthesis
MNICILIQRSRPFSARDFHAGAVGGTQAALVVLAEGFAALGHSVTVANTLQAPVSERSVRYCGQEDVRGGRFDLLLLVRDWAPVVESIESARRLLLLTDVEHPDRATLPRAFAWARHVLLMSRFQEGRLLQSHGEPFARLPRTVVGLPIEIADYGDFAETREPLLLYCSVPGRGLVHLQRILPAIRRRVPEAQLVVTSDTTLWGQASQRARYESKLSRIDGLEYLGGVTRPELVDLQKRARVLAYPCHFIEGFCLSAAECLVSGAVPVTTKDFALVETVGDRGVLVKGRPDGFLYRYLFVRAAVRLLTDDRHWLAMARRARADGLSRFAPRTVCERVLALAAAA